MLPMVCQIYWNQVHQNVFNEISREVTTNAMQLMGGYGFNKEYKMERRVRDSLVGELLAEQLMFKK